MPLRPLTFHHFEPENFVRANYQLPIIGHVYSCVQTPMSGTFGLHLFFLGAFLLLKELMCAVYGGLKMHVLHSCQTVDSYGQPLQ